MITSSTARVSGRCSSGDSFILVVPSMSSSRATTDAVGDSMTAGVAAVFSTLMLYDKGSYDTWGNFSSVEWFFINIIMTTNCTDNIL